MKVNPILAASSCLFLGLVQPLFADEAYQTCIDATGTNTGWAECGVALIGREEKKMEGVWARLTEVTEGETMNRLQAEQDAWSNFYAVACQLYNDQEAFGREGQVLSLPYCQAEAVVARTEQLKAYLRQIDP